MFSRKKKPTSPNQGSEDDTRSRLSNLQIQGGNQKDQQNEEKESSNPKFEVKRKKPDLTSEEADFLLNTVYKKQTAEQKILERLWTVLIELVSDQALAGEEEKLGSDEEE